MTVSASGSGLILAINLNAAVDRILFIDRFIPGATMRTRKTILSIGSKGLDTALILKTLNAPSKAISFIAGKNGEVLADLLAEQGIDAELIWLPGDTRLAHVIVEMDLNRHSHVTTSGYTVCPGDLQAMLEKIDGIAGAASWAVIAGTLPPGAPPGFYREIIELLHARGVKVLIDATGAPLLSALAANPEIAKMNQQEFQETMDVRPRDWNDWIHHCRIQMKSRRMSSLVLTCGKDGILAFTPDGEYHAGCPEEAEVNAAGSGDAVSAALAFRLGQGDAWVEALRWAAAAGAATVKTEGTAECHFSDILDIYPQVWVNEVASDTPSP